MADQSQVNWEDIVLGNRETRERVHMDEWWKETAAMVDRGYRHFYEQRGEEPPGVSREVLEFPIVFFRCQPDDRVGPAKGQAHKSRCSKDDDATQL